MHQQGPGDSKCHWRMLMEQNRSNNNCSMNYDLTLPRTVCRGHQLAGIWGKTTSALQLHMQSFRPASEGTYFVATLLPANKVLFCVSSSFLSCFRYLSPVVFFYFLSLPLSVCFCNRDPALPSRPCTRSVCTVAWRPAYIY